MTVRTPQIDAETTGRVAALLCRHADRASIVAACLEDLGLETEQVDAAIGAALQRLRDAVAHHGADG